MKELNCFIKFRYEILVFDTEFILEFIGREFKKIRTRNEVLAKYGNELWKVDDS